MYDINLKAMSTTILSIRGVTIPIYLVSSTTDFIRRCVVLFKPVPVLTSDPKSEFLCQSSLQLRRTYRPPLNTLYAWDISHAFVTTYHPYSHSPSALTEYLKQKLRHQRAKRLGCSPTAQVEQNVPLERNIDPPEDSPPVRSVHSGHIICLPQYLKDYVPHGNMSLAHIPPCAPTPTELEDRYALPKLRRPQTHHLTPYKLQSTS